MSETNRDDLLTNAVSLHLYRNRKDLRVPGTNIIDADSMEAMGAIAPTAKKIVGAMPQVAPRDFSYVIFERVKCAVEIRINLSLRQ